MAAINALTGEPSTGFGNNGEIEMKIPYDGAPTIYKNVILMGSNFYGPGNGILRLSWIRAPANPATRTPTTRALEKSYGSFTRSRAKANQESKRGASIVGRIARATTSGRSRSQSMKIAASFTCPSAVRA